MNKAKIDLALELVFTHFLIQTPGKFLQLFLIGPRNSCSTKDNQAIRYDFNLPHSVIHLYSALQFHLVWNLAGQKLDRTADSGNNPVVFRASFFLSLERLHSACWKMHIFLLNEKAHWLVTFGVASCSLFIYLYSCRPPCLHKTEATLLWRSIACVCHI